MNTSADLLTASPSTAWHLPQMHHVLFIGLVENQYILTYTTTNLLKYGLKLWSLVSWSSWAHSSTQMAWPTIHIVLPSSWRLSSTHHPRKFRFGDVNSSNKSLWYFAPLKQYIKSSILGNENQNLMVILLMTLHHCTSSTLLLSSVLIQQGTAHGLKLSLVSAQPNSS